MTPIAVFNDRYCTPLESKAKALQTQQHQAFKTPVQNYTRSKPLLVEYCTPVRLNRAEQDLTYAKCRTQLAPAQTVTTSIEESNEPYRLRESIYSRTESRRTD